MVTFTIKIAHKGHRKSSSEVNKPISKKVYGLIKEDANGICCCLVKCKRSISHPLGSTTSPQ